MHASCRGRKSLSRAARRSVRSGYWDFSANTRWNKLLSTTLWRLRIRWFLKAWRRRCKGIEVQAVAALLPALLSRLAMEDCMILVTGAAGLSGSALVREFSRHGVAVRALVRDRSKASARL